VSVDLEMARTLTELAVEVSPSWTLGVWAWEGGMELEFDAESAVEPGLRALRITGANLAWEIGPWAFDAEVLLDPVAWIDDLYWMELDAEADFVSMVCGKGTWGVTLWCTQSAVSKAETELTITPHEQWIITLTSHVDLKAGTVDAAAFAVETSW